MNESTLILRYKQKLFKAETFVLICGSLSSYFFLASHRLVPVFKALFMARLLSGWDQVAYDTPVSIGWDLRHCLAIKVLLHTQGRSVHIRTYARAYSWDLRKEFFSLNCWLIISYFHIILAFFIRIPIIQALIIQCWPLIMAKCTPPSRSASLTSFPSPAGILEGEVTMPWRVASEQNVFAVNGD